MYLLLHVLVESLHSLQSLCSKDKAEEVIHHSSKVEALNVKVLIKHHQKSVDLAIFYHMQTGPDSFFEGALIISN